MKKSILNLGQALNREEQKEVIGGITGRVWVVVGGPFQGIDPIDGTGQPGGPGNSTPISCSTDMDCPYGLSCSCEGTCYDATETQFVPC
jgi:hypothetical protein